MAVPLSKTKTAKLILMVILHIIIISLLLCVTNIISIMVISYFNSLKKKKSLHDKNAIATYQKVAIYS